MTSWIAARLTAFAAAAALFQVQLWSVQGWLPDLGAAPAVWITALAGYQTLLVAGYALAHLAQRLRRGGTAAILGLWALSLAWLWAAPESGALDSQAPVRAVWQALLTGPGLPFLALATTAPVLQWWLAGGTPGPSPYRLAGSSNLGSLVGLLSYPLLFEPWLTLPQLEQGWQVAVTLIGGVGVPLCGWLGRSAAETRAAPPVVTSTWRTRARWVCLAAIPTGLLASYTLVLTTNISPMPWLWSVPLALYLLSHILAFTRPRLRGPGRIGLLSLALLLIPLRFAAYPYWPPLCLLGGLFLACWVLHSELAARKPATGELTHFYLWLALGGALGGVTTSTLFPLLLPVLWETAFWLSAAAAVLWYLTRWDEATPPPQSRYRHLWATAALLAAGGIAYLATQGWGHVALTQQVHIYVPLLTIATLNAAVLVFRRRQLGWFLLALLVAGWAPLSPPAGQTVRGRSFYGVHTLESVAIAGSAWVETYTHGNTVHNRNQFELQPDYRTTPAPPRHWLYYGSTEPIGEIMRNLFPPAGAGRQVGIVGLGAGSLACYSHPGEQWTFFEIDPLVLQWAQQHMSTLAHCTPPAPHFELGDARQSLQARPPPAPRFDLLVLDAFSSDALPTHLLTREALALYRSRITPEGVLAFHISNQYLCLERVLAPTAAQLGLYSRVQEGPTSKWLMVTASASQGAALLPEGQPVVAQGAPWTDRYRPLLPALCAW